MLTIIYKGITTTVADPAVISRLIAVLYETPSVAPDTTPVPAPHTSTPVSKKGYHKNLRTKEYPRRNMRYTAQEHETILKMFNAGKSVEDIALAVGRDRESVNQKLTLLLKAKTLPSDGTPARAHA